MKTSAGHNSWMANQGLLEEMAAILAESSASMAGVDAHATPALRSGWWKQRLALDARVSRLLKAIEARWLGPWRCA